MLPVILIAFQSIPRAILGVCPLALHPESPGYRRWGPFGSVDRSHNIPTHRGRKRSQRYWTNIHETAYCSRLSGREHNNMNNKYEESSRIVQVTQVSPIDELVI